jgi:hypothetical protein
MSRCGHIIPLNSYPKTHFLRKKLILQPRNNQVQHIVVKKNYNQRMKQQWKKKNLDGDHVPWWSEVQVHKARA